jgi:sortase A
MRNKNLLLVLLIISLGIAGIIIWRMSLGSSAPLSFPAISQSAPSALIGTQSSLNSSQVVTVTEPKKLVIPAIKVDTNVESVGLDKKGAMDVPKDVKNVSWYNLGVKPGEKGNAVMAGHLDTETGSKAVFYDLNKLIIGDEIMVEDQDGKVYKYKVVNTGSYDYNKFPIEQVFGKTEKAMLNLITCQGTWNQASQNYSQRYVVYAKLI